MPALGMAQETGKLVRWFKREGEAVTKGEPLMEVETDKAAVEVESPATVRDDGGGHVPIVCPRS